MTAVGYIAYIEENENGDSFVARHPEMVSNLLDVVVRENCQFVSHELNQILSIINDVDSNLTKDRRFEHLFNLVQ